MNTMTAGQPVFDTIIANTSRFNTQTVRRVLLLYEEKITYIGDCCARFDKLRYFKSFLNNAVVHINFTNKENYEFSEGLLKNNPYLDSMTLLDWNDIRFEEYDCIFCIAYAEDRLLDFLNEKYGEEIFTGQFKATIFSISALLLIPQEQSNYIFPVCEGLIKYVMIPNPGEIYITQEEREWGNRWLEERGITREERLFVMCDSSSTKSKVLGRAVYFDLLHELLSIDDCRILIFDEGNVGKEEFYRKWLGTKHMKRFIFSKGLSLRNNLCLIASSYTKMVFGPCTGLMHCASAMYNYYMRCGMRPQDAPLMITYTGIYTKENKNADFWWGRSPLIHCLLLREKDGNAEMVVLSELNENERSTVETLPCSAYTKEMLIRYMRDKNIFAEELIQA